MTPGVRPPAPEAGLCEACRYVRVVETRTGSRFFLCQRSASDPAFPRYPRLPVLRCVGYEALRAGREGDGIGRGG